MIFSLLSFFTLVPSLLGWGFATERLLQKTSGKFSLNTMWEKGMIGMMSLTALATLIHFFFPLSGAVIILLHFVGWCLFGLLYFSRLQKGKWRVPFAGVTIFLAAATYFSYTAMLATPTYDTGLYHLQAVLWNREYALSPGLANLHDRFGINSSWFVFAASLGLPKLWGSALLLPNALLMVFVLLSIHDHWKIAVQKKETHFLAATLAMIITAWSFPNFIGEINSISTDFPAMLLMTYCVFTLYFWQSEIKQILPIVLLLSFFSVLIKFSTLPFFAGIFIWFLWSNRSKWITFFKMHMSIFAFLFLLGVPWLARGYYLSGCLLFPVEQTCLNREPWAVDPVVAENIRAWIYSWARMPGVHPSTVLASWDWFAPWWERFLNSGFSQLLYQAAFLGSLAICWRISQGERTHAIQLGKPTRSILGLLAIVVLYWFFSAPDPRFIAGTFASTLFLLTSMFLNAVLQGSNLTLSVNKVNLLFFAFLVIQTLKLQPQASEDFQYPIWRRLPQAFQESRETVHGQVIFVPTAGDQCWAIELPCTPYFNPNLLYEQQGSRLIFTVE